MFFSSIKDINRYVKHLLLRKTDVLKTSILWERKFEKIHYLWKAKRYKVYSGNIYFGIIIFSCFWSTVPCLGFLLICFDWEIKGFYQSSLGNEVDFTDTMNVSPNAMARNLDFKKLRHGFVDKRTVITTTLTSSCHPCTFLLAKENTWKHILTLNSELCKIVQKNKLCHSKQH